MELRCHHQLMNASQAHVSYNQFDATGILHDDNCVVTQLLDFPYSHAHALRLSRHIITPPPSSQSHRVKGPSWLNRHRRSSQEPIASAPLLMRIPYSMPSTRIRGRRTRRSW
jgi:hypothetical protein